MTSPAATLKTVCLREEVEGLGSWYVAVDGGGGGTEKRARS